MSDTPRTDAAIIERGAVVTHGDPTTVGGAYIELPDLVSADFARQLERELNAAKQRQIAPWISYCEGT